MKQRYKLYALALMGTLALTAQAQTSYNAGILMENQLNGTARFVGMGGAMSALGGDLSTFAVNPGGIGVFRKSEVSFTSTLDFAKLKSGRFDHDKNTYLVGSLGFVASFTTGNAKWKYINFGLNYTNLNNFNREGRTGGHISANNSLIDVWKLEADGTARDNLNPFTTSLAYDAYLLKRDPDNENMYTIPLADGDRMEQWENIDERGYQGEYDISVGTNYDDKLYLGATLGIQTIHFRADNMYREGVPTGEEREKIMIMASIAEAEVNSQEYYGKVTRVILNRIDIGMPLGMDTTVAYGLGITAAELTDAMLADDSNPYNTRIHQGLPPTPISNPGDNAIQAAMNPEQGDWLYFVTTNLQTGETKFAVTEDEFWKIRDEYKNNNPNAN